MARRPNPPNLNLVTVLLIVSMVLGLCIGGIIKASSPQGSLTSVQISYIRFPGDLFTRMLKMLTVPLVASSIITGISSLEAKSAGIIARRIAIYNILTSFIAVIVGITMALIIRPGIIQSSEEYSLLNKTFSADRNTVKPVQVVLDLFRNCFPDNIFGAIVQKTVTTEVLQNSGEDFDDIFNTSEPSPTYKIRSVMVNGSNVLGIIVFSAAFAVALRTTGYQSHVVRDFFEITYESLLLLVKAIIWYAPVGVFFITCTELIKMTSSSTNISQLSWYFATVIIGLSFHSFVILPLGYFLVVKKNPLRFLCNSLEALVTAMTTASSAATLPVTMRCSQELNHIDVRIIKSTIPVGAFINMDGTAMYEAIAAIFINQVSGLDMTFEKVCLISLSATISAIGCAGVPSAGLTALKLVLYSIDLPGEAVGLVLSVDWLLDRFRTPTNVWSDIVGAAIVEKLSVEEIPSTDFNMENI